MRRRTNRVGLAAAFLLTTAAIALAATAAPTPPNASAASNLRLNQMQVIASHNSYHVEQPPDVIAFYEMFDPEAITLAYTHTPLPEQFDNEKVRAIELDVHPDPGGLFRPLGNTTFKVFHIEQIDEDSTCETLIECLQVAKGWSDAHPTHMPIMIQLEIKDTVEVPGPPDSPPMTPELYEQLDAEIRSVLPPDRLITPDDVRGSHSTLEEAVLTDGWPTIDSVRGRFLFTLDNKRDEYVAGHPSLQGRVAFAPSEPGQPDAAFLKMNDPLGSNQALIASRVQAGYVIRTRADEPVRTAQSGDTTQRDAALASGAQWVSTDYPVEGLSERWGTDYVAFIPGGTPARCNPVNAPPGCVNSMVEDLTATAPTSSTASSSTTSTTAGNGGTGSTARTAAAASPAAVTPRFTG